MSQLTHCLLCAGRHFRAGRGRGHSAPKSSAKRRGHRRHAAEMRTARCATRGGRGHAEPCPMPPSLPAAGSDLPVQLDPKGSDPANRPGWRQRLKPVQGPSGPRCPLTSEGEHWRKGQSQDKPTAAAPTRRASSPQVPQPPRFKLLPPGGLDVGRGGHDRSHGSRHSSSRPRWAPELQSQRSRGEKSTSGREVHVAGSAPSRAGASPRGFRGERCASFQKAPSCPVSQSH